MRRVLLFPDIRLMALGMSICHLLLLMLLSPSSTTVIGPLTATPTLLLVVGGIDWHGRGPYRRGHPPCVTFPLHFCLRYGHSLMLAILHGLHQHSWTYAAVVLHLVLNTEACTVTSSCSAVGMRVFPFTGWQAGCWSRCSQLLRHCHCWLLPLVRYAFEILITLCCHSACTTVMIWFQAFMVRLMRYWICSETLPQPACC